MNVHSETAVGARESREQTIQRELVELLTETPARDLRHGLEQAVARRGHDVYPEAIYLLAHLRFSPDEARRHWGHILRLHDSMCDRLDSQIDVRVAMISYFLDIDRKLHSPTVVELHVLRETQSYVYRDGLTGLYNYRYFRDHIASEIERFQRLRATLSLLMIDIDDFKIYNDKNGHQLGNDALVGVADIIRSSLDPGDTAVRYGGEEFVVMLPGVPKAAAVAVAELLRAAVEARGFENEAAQPSGSLTVSVGLATYPADADDGAELLLAADRAMYAAKSMGRNRVHIYGDDMRSFRRVDANTPAVLRVVDAGAWECTALNISEAGVLLHTRRAVELGAAVEVEFAVPEVEETVCCIGRAVRVIPVSNGSQVAVRIVDIPGNQRQALVRWVRSNERQAYPIDAP